jgi:hypothetical protein
MAAKLEALSSDAVQVEQVVARIVTERATQTDPSVLCDLQRLDYLSQSLRDIARLAQALSLEDQDRAPLLSLIQLASTRALLHEKQVLPAHQPGAFDLF